MLRGINMIKVRYGVFESNSSSVHSLIMCGSNEYYEFMNNKLLYYRWEDRFISNKEALDKLYKEVKDEDEFMEDFNLPYGFSRDELDKIPLEYLGAYLNNFAGILSSDYMFGYDFEYETFDNDYTTSNGEVVHAFGYYSHD